MRALDKTCLQVVAQRPTCSSVVLGPRRTKACASPVAANLATGFGSVSSTVSRFAYLQGFAPGAEEAILSQKMTVGLIHIIQVVPIVAEVLMKHDLQVS